MDKYSNPGSAVCTSKLDGTPIIMAYHHKDQIQVEHAGASTVWGYLSLHSFHHWAKTWTAADTPDNHTQCRFDFALSYKRVMAALKESRGPLMMT